VIFEAVRKACGTGLWSQGVKLAREGAVLFETKQASEVVARVRSPRHAVPPTVTLYVEDGEWTCDCGGRVDPCEHVAATAIALHQGVEAAPAQEAPAVEAKPRAPEPARAHVGYRFTRQDRSLYLQRAIVSEGQERPLPTALSSVIARGAAPGLVPTHEDLALDKILGPSARVFVPVVRTPEIFGLLAGARDVTLDGKPIRTAATPMRPRAVVRDQGGQIALTIERDPRVREVVARGAVRSDQDLIHPIAEIVLSGDLLEKLPRTRTFEKARWPELATEIVPRLSERIEIAIESTRLPKRSRTLKPRIVLELARPVLEVRDAGPSLSVLARLVYGDPPQARIDDGALVHLQGDLPVRDEGAERRLVQRLRDELNLMIGRRIEIHGREALGFAKRLESWAIDDPEQSIAARTPLSPKIELDDDRFEATFELEGAPDKRASAASVLRAWRDGLGLVPLEGGGWAKLPIEWLSKHGQRLEDLLAAKGARDELPKSAAPQIARFCEALERPPPPSFARLAEGLASFERIPRAELPELAAELRGYQRAGVDWLCFLRDHELGAVLADDMGLGKTLQTIAAMKGRTLVVAPKSVVHNWAAEIARFRPSLRVSLYHGPRRTLDETADVILTTYAVLRLDVDRLASERFDVAVLDEAQSIKNPDSQAARAAFRISARFRVALSGTPVENRLDELWSVFHFASPGLLGGRSDFDERYARPIGSGEEGAAARLRALIAPFLLRRLKREVAPELPPRTDVVLQIELEEQERAVYDTVRAATKKDLLDRLQEGGNVLAALEALLRLRQAACHSGLVPGQRAETSSKVETLVEKLADAAADGHKALVFSQWTALLDKIEPRLEEAGIAFTRLDGSTLDRAGVVAKFQADDGPPVMLVSLKAGGTGLNLTAADHVFLCDPWWNPAAEDQAADRAHRIGQERPVFVYRMVAKDTVEEGILALQEKKRAIAGVALEGGGQATAITREELLALLG
jgi:superfamily II DNA or RNA helicase